MAAADARVFGDKFLAMDYTLEAETSVSNLTQYKLFIGDDKKNTLFGVTFSFNDWPLGKQWVLFPLDLNVPLGFASGNIELLGETKLTVSLVASH